MSKITKERILLYIEGLETTENKRPFLKEYVKQQERKEDLSKRIIEQCEGLVKLLEGCAELGCYDNKNRLDYNGFKNVIKSLKEELEND